MLLSELLVVFWQSLVFFCLWNHYPDLYLNFQKELSLSVGFYTQFPPFDKVTSPIACIKAHPNDLLLINDPCKDSVSK